VKKVAILDTSAIFTGVLNYIPFDVEIYITNSVISEVRDSNSKYRLETALQSGRVKILNPPTSIVKRVLQEGSMLGEIINLSQTDIEVVALALYFYEKGFDVTVFTDDYSVQNLCKRFGIKFTPTKTEGIKKVRKYIYKCPACGYKSKELPPDRKCPICGSELKRRLFIR